MRRAGAVLAAALALAACAVAPAGAAGRETKLFAFGGTAAEYAPHAGAIDIVAPQWFSLDEGGQLHGGPRDYELLRLARESRSEVWPVVNQQLGFRDAWLRDPVPVATRIARAARAFDGITIDVEEIPPEAGAAFTGFIQELKRQLGPRGLGVYAVRRTDQPPRRSAAAYDWRALSESADLVLAATYGEHGPPGEPGPLVTWTGFNDVLRYAQNVSAQRVAPVLAGFAVAWPALGTEPGEVVASAGLPADGPPARVGSRIAWYDTGQMLQERRAAAARAGFTWVALFSLGREPAEFWDVR